MVVIGYAGRSTGSHHDEWCIVTSWIELGTRTSFPRTSIGTVERVKMFQMTDTHPVFQASSSTFPITCSCLETKMAASETSYKPSGGDDYTTGSLIEGKFDIEALLAQLTIEEKASLLSGIVKTCSGRMHDNV